MHVDTGSRFVVAGRVAVAVGSAVPRADTSTSRACAPGRCGEHPESLRQRREPVAVAGGLAHERKRATGAEDARALAERDPRGSGRWWSTAWPRTRSNDSSANGSRSASARRTSTSRPRSVAVASSRLSIPGEMSIAVASSTIPRREQVEREVAGPGADLERAPVPTWRPTERLRQLHQHLAPPDVPDSRSPTWRRSSRRRRRGSERLPLIRRRQRELGHGNVFETSRLGISGWARRRATEESRNTEPPRAPSRS